VRYIKKQETPPAFTDWKEKHPLSDYDKLGKKSSNKIKKIVHQSLIKERQFKNEVHKLESLAQKGLSVKV
jgi:hypothetical protein